MDIIQLLPEHVTNQIAAGEVIQRPASAVKEILENSLDAGANNIQLYIKDSGKTLIQIIDNGCGMSVEDAKICFKRHATSKIKTSNDLFEIQTMGFRGEALASIAAISHVEMKTKLHNNELGTKLKIEGGIIKNCEECNLLEGTSIKIKNIFYNIPARRKFLKSDKVEMQHIIESFIRIAISHPNIKLQLFHNDTEIFHLNKSNFRQRIVNIMGIKKNEVLVPINEETSIVKITGFIGKPESAKKTRGEQYLYVNNRFIKSPYFNHAINKAYKDLIPEKYFPSFFIKLETSPKLIDINIHPTKTEIKFEDEKSIYAIIQATTRRSLGQYNIAPSIDFSQEVSFDLSHTESKTKTIKQPKIRIDKDYNPFKTSFIQPEKEKNLQIEIKKLNGKDIEPSLNSLQINKQYIAYTSEEGLILIHQERAHKRIIFEELKRKMSKKEKISQNLIFPEKLNFNSKDIRLIIDLKEKLNKIGFSFSQIEDNSISISSIPIECDGKNIQAIIESLIEQYKINNILETEESEKLIIHLANSMSISNNKKLSQQEMEELRRKLSKCQQPNTCPQGKKIILNLKKNEIEKYF